MWTTAGHIYLYASEKNRPRPRLARHYLPPRTEAGRVTVARASYDGNWNPEPLALPVFAAAVAESSDVQLRLVESRLGAIHTLEPRPQLVMVSGTDTHDFSQEQRQAIKGYVESGGVILFESAGGRGAFARDAEKMAVELWEMSIDPLRNSRIVTGEGLEKATPMTHLDYGSYTHQVLAARETTPRLRGMTVGDRPRVLFTHQDITHALLDQPCWGIAGYTPESARALLANILLHAMEP